jgi:hypothetical protein
MRLITRVLLVPTLWSFTMGTVMSQARGATISGIVTGPSGAGGPERDGSDHERAGQRHISDRVQRRVNTPRLIFLKVDTQ